MYVPPSNRPERGLDEIRSAFIHANAPRIPGMAMPSFERDEKNRVKFPAYLLAAHKAN
jgi:hypothetical protein